MLSQSNLNNVVANIVAEKRYSHCRLCLSEIGRDYVRFQDQVMCGPDDVRDVNILQPLSELLSYLLGAEICDEISGAEAICPSCMDMALNSYQFVKKCEASTTILKNIFNNLSNALVSAETITEPNNTQCLYFKIDQSSYELVFSDKRKQNQIKSLENKCLHCDETFENESDLAEHHCQFGERSLLCCPKCFQAFHNKIDFEEHICKNPCKYCVSLSNNDAKLKEHQEKCHLTFICKDCGKICKGSTKLEAHEESHAAKNNCPKCGKQYLTKSTYLKHVELCLNDQIDPQPYRSNYEKKFICAECGKGYSTHGGLKVHEKFIHGNGQFHSCPVCQKQFIAPSCLKNHMVKHTRQRNFKCNICSNNFVSKEALISHTRRHTGEKPYSCQLCNEKFVNASARAEHIKYKHRAPQLECPICFRKVYTKTFLKLHMKRHENPASKLYVGRNTIPPNQPSSENVRWVLEDIQ